MNTNNEEQAFRLWISTISMIIIALLVIMASIISSHATSLDKNVIFKHNGNEFKTGSFVHNGRIFVPLRMLSQQFGFKVDWDGVHKTIGISNGNHFAQFQLGLKSIFLSYENEEETIIMDVKPLVVDGITFVPVRYAVESLGKFIEYFEDDKVRVINITDIRYSHNIGK